MFRKKRCSLKFRKIHRKTSVPESAAEACKFIKKETLAQVFSWEFCEILKNTFFTEHFWATGSDVSYKILVSQWLLRSPVFFRLPKGFTIKIFFRLFECFLLESNFRKLYICSIWIKKGCYLHFLQHCADERVSQFFNPFNATDLFWYPPENIRKPLVFCFQGVSKEISSTKWV